MKSIKEIAEPAGGVVALSKALGLSRGAVSQWRRVPAERVVDVARITGLSREQIRPDLYTQWAPRAPRGEKEAA